MAEHHILRICNSIIKYGIVDSLCIGLFGAWGCGKTSILNMVLEEIETNSFEVKKPKTIRFEPWNFTSTDQLLSQFFLVLSNELLSDKDKSKTALAAALVNYGESLDALNIVPVFGGALAALGKTGVKISSKKLNKGTERKGIQEQKKVVETLLRDIDQKFLIVIDDIDRLSNEQIRQVFQLVTAVARFPNLVYLLVFDRDVVVKALEKVQEGNGNAYLEKVIQVPIHVPEISREKKELVLFEKLNNMLDVYSTRFDKKYWGSIFLSCIRPYIKSLREINRIVNLLQFKLASVAEEVNFVDMVALTTIETVYPEVYEWIASHKSALTGVRELDENYLMYMDIDEKEIFQVCCNELKDILKSAGYANPDADCEKLVRCIKKIFPYWGEKQVRRYSLDVLRREDRVAHPERFFRYFNLDINEISLLRNEINRAAKAMPCEELGEYLLLLDAQDKLAELLAEIEVIAKELSSERARIWVTALLQNTSRFQSQSSKHLFGLATSELARLLANQIMAEHKDVDWGSYFVRLIEMADWDTLLGIAGFLHIMFLAHGKYTGNAPRTEYDQIIDETELAAVEAAYEKKIKDNIADYDILSYPKARIAFLCISWIDKEFVDRYLDDALVVPLNLIKYMSASVSRWHGSDVGYELNNGYLERVSDEIVLHAIMTCVADKTLFTLSEYEQNAAAAFCLLKANELSNAEDEDRATESQTQALIRKWEQGIT